MSRKHLVTGVAVLALAATAVTYAVTGEGQIGPALHETGNGRVLHPAGALTEVGNFPTGGALTPNGKFYWAVSTGRGYNDIRIVDVRSNRLLQTVHLPGSSGGIAMNTRKPVVYVSGVHDSRHRDERQDNLKGRHGDVIHVLRYNRHSGRAKETRVIKTPPPSGSLVPQDFPPDPDSKPVGWPDRLAYSAAGNRLLVPLNLADRALIVNLTTHKKTYAVVGHYPYGAAVVAGGTKGLISNEADGTVSVVQMANGLVTKTIAVGPPLSHPESISVDPRAHRAYVTMANTDHVAVISTTTMKKVADFSLRRSVGLGVSPVAGAVDPIRHRLYVAEEGADDVAVLSISRTMPRLIGRIPTAAFPTDVATSHNRVVWLSAKGFGVGPDLDGPQPVERGGAGGVDINKFDYLPAAVRGDVGVLAAPRTADLPGMTRVAVRQMVPVDRTDPPAHTPLRPNGPIKHVFFVVKENRTYDQILGDDPRGDGDRHLELFGRNVTPNVHSLVRRFPLLDHVYADSEASIDGHFWTSAATVSDYVQKNWMHFYALRGRPDDFGVYAVSWPGNGFLFDQALRQNISFFNYGEAFAGDFPMPDRDRTPALVTMAARKLAHSDIGVNAPGGVGPQPAGSCYPSDRNITANIIALHRSFDGSRPAGGYKTAASRFACFRQHFKQQLATNSVPAFNYMVLPNDHTIGTAHGLRTPQAMVADNDYGLGEVVDTISHSKIWKSSAIFVIEDDSQDGADHVDAHRIPAEVISPYTQAGAVVHHRYDTLSVVRSIELILGMEPLSLNDALAEPMYDVFTSSPVNSAPFNAIVPQQNRLQVNAPDAPDAALSASLDFSNIDQVPQHLLDRILWHAVYGEDSTPPPPGPHAEDESLDGD
jgi:DNA-binding beta-propeller fold protein YncE